jgi:hypothetical protein
MGVGDRKEGIERWEQSRKVGWELVSPALA